MGSILTSTRICRALSGVWADRVLLSEWWFGGWQPRSQERAAIAGNSCILGDLLNGGMEMLKGSNLQNRSITLPWPGQLEVCKENAIFAVFQRLSRAASWVLLSPREHIEVGISGLVN